MSGWLINDCLTCIPDTKTFWHDLLDWLPGLVDMTGTHYDQLASVIEQQSDRPQYLIRNASFFRPLIMPGVKQIVFLQDILEGALRKQQIDVCHDADIVIFNSEYTASHYPELTGKVISIGIDFDFFKPLDTTIAILPNSILFVGANNVFPKGFDVIRKLIDTTDYNFCLVMKDDFTMVHPRVRVFNKVTHDILRDIYNACSVLICTSKFETAHLAGIEAGACNTPIIATNVGVYFNQENKLWGELVKDSNFEKALEFVFSNYSKYQPREYFRSQGYTKKCCQDAWMEMINVVLQ